MKLLVGHATDIGRKRTQNQDTLGAYPELGLFVVADGMGGHRGGETASAMSVQAIENSIRSRYQEIVSKKVEAKVCLSEAIRSANRDIHESALKNASLHGMGTTTTALLFHHDTLSIGHVGDSRCYFIRPQGIWQMTRDHSMVQEKLRAGLITRDQMKTDRMKNVITRSVGFETDVSVEIYEYGVKPGDVFLICSDGLSGLIEDLDIRKIIEKNLLSHKDMDRTVQALVDDANDAGGDDNVSVVVVQVLEVQTPGTA